MTDGLAEAPLLYLYTRPDCGLCETLEAALQADHAGRYRLQRRCVDDRLEWKKAWGLRIPVLTTAAGELLCEGRYDPPRLARYFGSASA